MPGGARRLAETPSAPVLLDYALGFDMRQKPLGRRLVRGHDVRVDVEAHRRPRVPHPLGQLARRHPGGVPGGTAAVAKIVP